MWEDAKGSSKPIVLFFVEKDDEATRDIIRGHKVSTLSKESAVFVLVVKPAEVEPPKAAERRGPTITSGGRRAADGEAKEADASKPVETVSIIPVSPLNAANLWKAYGITAAGSVVVADWFGNAKNTYPRAPRESDLVRAIETMPSLVERDAKVLTDDLKRLEGYVEKDDSVRAVKQAVKLFKRNIAGHEAITTATTHWTKLMDEGRRQISGFESEADVVRLRGLRSTYKDTDIEPELNAAIERAVAATKK